MNMKKMVLICAMLVSFSGAWAYGEYTDQFAGGTGTADDPYLISTIAHISTLSTSSTYLTTFDNTYFEMVNDIEFDTSNPNFLMWGIGLGNRMFQGHFDGKGHKITNVTITNAINEGALFNWVGQNGTVKNLTLENVRFSGTTANNQAPFAGHLSGRIENCHVTNAEVDYSQVAQNNFNGGFVAYLTSTGVVSGCTFSGTAKTACGFGGIVGRNYGGNVENCSSDATIVICRGNTYVGGIGGTTQWFSNGAAVNYDNCRFSGRIYQNMHYNGNNVGGIAGYGAPVTIKACANHGEITAVGYVGGIAGYLGNNSLISDSYNIGRVEDIFVAHDSTDISFGMTSNIAGVVAYLSGGTIERCFNGGTLGSLRLAAGIIGTAASMTAAINVNDCYNAGLINAPFVWKTGNTTIQKASGIAGEQTGQFDLQINRCLSLGTINNAVAARNSRCEYIGYDLTPERIVISDCYYDKQMAGNTSQIGALATSQLISGTTLNGFSTDTWLFTEGLYPRLKSTSTTTAATLCAAPIKLAETDIFTKVKQNFVFTTTGGVEWSFSSANHLDYVGDTLIIVRSETPDNIVATSILNGLEHQNLLTIYPDAFDGEGSADNPYLIYDLDDMKRLSEATNQGGMTFDGDHFRVMNDIDMQDDDFPPFSLSEAKPFLATFDGQGFTLNRLSMNNHTNQRQFAGLFGYIGNTGVVKNLVIGSDSQIGLYLNGGTIAAYLDGAIENCRVRVPEILSSAGSGTFGGIVGTVAPTGRVSDCYVGAVFNLNGATNYVAGIAKDNYGLIEGCQFAGNINGTSANYLGGIVSQNFGTIDNCLSSGIITGNQYVGGIAARSFVSGGYYPQISNSLSTAIVSFNANVDLTGAVTGDNSSTTYTNVAFDRQITPADNFANSGITPLTTLETIRWNAGTKWVNTDDRYPQLAKFASEDMAWFSSLPISFPEGQTRLDLNENAPATLYASDAISYNITDGTYFEITDNALCFTGSETFSHDKLLCTYQSANTSYTRLIPLASYGTPFEGSGTANDPWIIATEDDLLRLANQSNAENNHNDYAGKHFLITADITLTQPWPVISSCKSGTLDNLVKPKRFSGIIHGDNHAIANLNVTNTGSNSTTGLVGYLGLGGRIENLTIASGTITGVQNTGAFAGYCLAGDLTVLTNFATVKATNNYIGGIAGQAIGATMDKLINNGPVIGTTMYAGGIAGSINGSDGRTYANFENHATVCGTMYTGGIAGLVNNAQFDIMVNTGDITNPASATYNLNGGIFGVVNVCQSITRCYNYGNFAGTGSTGIGGVIGRYWPSANTNNALTVAHCLNAGNIIGKASYVGGIVGMVDNDKYDITVLGCANVGAITNTAASIAAGTPAAGGIVGGGAPVIENCYNAGVITGVNCIGGILGRAVNNSAPVTLRNNICTGWLEGYLNNAANIGTITGFNSTAATYENNIYDSQMSNIGAVAKSNPDGNLALYTTDIATAELNLSDAWKTAALRYPIPTALAQDSALMLYSLPVFLDNDDSRYNVTHNFTIATHEGFTWQADSVFNISNTRVIIAPKTNGTYNISATYSSFIRTIPLVVDYDVPAGDINGDGNIDVSDINILVGIMLGMDSPDNYAGRAYITDDNVIDISDVNALINLVLGK